MPRVDGIDDKYRKKGALANGVSEELQLKRGVYYQKAGVAL